LCGKYPISRRLPGRRSKNALLGKGVLAGVAALGLLGGLRCDSESQRTDQAHPPASDSVKLSSDATRTAGIQTAPAENAAVSPVVALTGTLAAKPWTPEEQTVMSDAEAADARRRLAVANFERLSRLSSQGVVARQDLDSARAERDQAQAAAAQADARLANLGLPGSSGSIGDLSRLWGLATLAEVDLPRIQAGETVDVTTGAFPDKHFRGRVVAVSRSADPQTRNFTVRIAIDDPQRLLRPQMLASFAVAVASSPGLAIPKSAVLLEGDGSYVYVDQGAGVFHKQRIRTGMETRDSVQVTGGLSAGQRIVVVGAQILESERLKASLKPADTD